MGNDALMVVQVESVTWDWVSRDPRRLLEARCEHVNRECVENENRMCQHVMDFFKSRSELMNDPIPARSLVWVPIFRRGIAHPKTGIKVSVSIGDEDEYGNRPFYFSKPEGVEKDVIDILSPSSGVWAMRNSIIQWAFSMYKNVQPCTTNKHRGRTWPLGPNDPRRHDAKKPPMIANILNLAQTDECLNCALDLTSLVPDL